MKLAKLNGKAEIFHTIQGEGKNMGVPSIFIRSSLCNLHCSWCDTDYTWNWENTPFITDTNIKYKKEDSIINLTPREIADIATTFNCKHVVLTGGEPLMHQKEFVELMQILRQIDDEYFFEVETNGTLIPNPDFDELINQYNVSPKLSNSNNEKNLRLKPKALQFFAEQTKSVFKFVAQHARDLNEVLDLIEQYKIPNNQVYLMPEGRSPQELKDKAIWLVEVCKANNFVFTDRMHIHLFGQKRGV